MTVTARPEPGQKTSWYRIENRVATEAATTVWLYDELGAWGVTAADFVREIQQIRGDIELRVSSPGGEVFDGIAIFNSLRNHRGKVTVYIDGVAASAASFIVMAGDHIIAERTATMMIHDAMGVAVGNANDMRDMADLLEKCSQNIASIYAERAGGTQDEWRKRMQAETWFTAAEAKAAGLVDEIVSATPNRNRAPTPTDGWDLSVFRYAGRDHAPAPAIAQVLAMACPMHDTATAEGTWDAGMQEGRMPSPMPMAMAKKMYAWIDEAQVDDGMMPKSAGKFPHHEVSADGMPGPANLSGVRNALARLSQADIPSSDRAAVEAHLRAHLPAAQPANHTHDDPPDEAGFSLPDIRDALESLNEIEWDPDLFTAAVTIVAHNSPAPPPAKPAVPEDPEPELSINLPDFRRAIREAHL